ncbi:hypothetical protein ZYGR_0AK06030 [Zygosaccharomyces rouxii]|uniref:Zn(2)-C6 fungal-type domain-containing protein n=1 Tax=Zygosaccharomyces rouxii TaxID=4956 RepID=A0A1Q3AEK7_ZYGRO|nr:hypothetical protein ZYGR_0AK06030 [Zygosaccharomyces rouxii]
MVDKDTKVPRRRRKAVKSCTFCRKRKLKCDHGKPMCRQCLDRKLPNCVYTDDFNFQLTTDELFSDSPNIELVQRIKELEAKVASLEMATTRSQQQQQQQQQQQISPPSSTDTPPTVPGLTSICGGAISLRPSGPGNPNNPLWEYRILYNCRGQNILYGPTSWRTMVASQGDRFQTEYRKLWDMIKPERDLWVVQNPVSQLSADVSQVILGTNENDTLLNAVCKYLPSYNEMEEGINEFFDGYIHDFLQILDKDKVIADFKKCVIPDSKSLVGFDHPIAQLIAPEGDGNYYKAAVILLIVYTAKTNGSVPPIVDKFFLSLSAINTASKLNFVERAQFLLLLYFCKVYCPNECSETPQAANLVSELCECALTLGLSNAEWWYQDKQDVVGPIHTLRNMWYWTLFADISISFEMGKPLFITDSCFDPAATFRPLEKPTAGFDISPESLSSIGSQTSLQEVLNGGTLQGRRLTMLLKYLKIGRRCILEINSINTSGDIDKVADELEEFVAKEFLPIKFYSSKLMLEQVDMFDIILLAPTFGMLLNFHNVSRITLKNNTPSNKNRVIKFGLLGLSICVNTILCTFERDSPGPKNDLLLALLLVNPLLMRILTEMYALFFFRLTLFEKGLIIAAQGISDLNLNDLRVPLENYYSFEATTSVFREILDQLFDPSRAELQKAISKSYQLTTSLALERVSRTVFDKGCTSRTITENNCRPEDAISQEALDKMTESFWETYEQQTQGVWSMKPEDFYTGLNANFDFDLSLK